MQPIGTDSEMSIVLEGIQTLMMWRTLPQFRATVRCRVGVDDETRVFELLARPQEHSYVVNDLSTGEIDSFEGATRTLTVGGETEELNIRAIVFEPMPARLAFPMSLGIWGRPFDDFRITGGRIDGDAVVLRLTYVQAPHIRGSLEIDRSLGMAVRLDSPTLQIEYEDVEPL